MDIFRVRGISDVLIIHSDRTLETLNLQMREAATGLFTPEGRIHFDVTRILKYGGNVMQEMTGPNVDKITIPRVIELKALAQNWEHPDVKEHREKLQRNHYLLPKLSVKHSPESLREKCLRRSIVLLSLANQSDEGQKRFEEKVLKNYYDDNTVLSIFAGHLEGEKNKHFQFALEILGNPYDVDIWLDVLQRAGFDGGEEVATRTIDIESTVQEDLVSSIWHPAIDYADVVSLELRLKSQREMNPGKPPSLELAYHQFILAQQALDQLDSAFEEIGLEPEVQHCFEEIRSAANSLDVNKLKQPVMDLLGVIARLIGATHPELEAASKHDPPGKVFGHYRDLLKGAPGYEDLQELFLLNDLKNVGSHEKQNPEYFKKKMEGLTFPKVVHAICVTLRHLRHLKPLNGRTRDKSAKSTDTVSTAGAGSERLASAPTEHSAQSVTSPGTEKPAGEVQEDVKIFVTYCHQDQKYLGGPGSLLDHLSGLSRYGIQFLHDRNILTTEKFDTAIQEYIDQADIVLALVSQPFLNSHYCQDIEAVRYLRLRRERGLRVFPVILSKCRWSDVDWLRETQFLPRDGKNVEEHFTRPGKRKNLFTQIMDELLAITAKVREERQRTAQ